jgi:hypothetical protein
MQFLNGNDRLQSRTKMLLKRGSGDGGVEWAERSSEKASKRVLPIRLVHATFQSVNVFMLRLYKLDRPMSE